MATALAVASGKQRRRFDPNLKQIKMGYKTQSVSENLTTLQEIVFLQTEVYFGGKEMVEIGCTVHVRKRSVPGEKIRDTFNIPTS